MSVSSKLTYRRRSIIKLPHSQFQQEDLTAAHAATWGHTRNNVLDYMCENCFPLKKLVRNKKKKRKCCL